VVSLSTFWYNCFVFCRGFCITRIRVAPATGRDADCGTMSESADQTKTIVFSILSFLQEEYNRPTTSADSKESIEVSLQCLETRFGVSLQDVRYKSPRTLRDLFQSGLAAAGGGGGGAAAGLLGSLGGMASPSQQQPQEQSPFVPPGMRGDAPVSWFSKGGGGWWMS
jgi:hypothetical protein